MHGQINISKFSIQSQCK